MPRNPLLARVVALAHARREADRLGVDVAEASGRQAAHAASDHGLTRRELMKRTVVAGAGAAAAGRLVLNPGKAFGAGRSSQPSVAIIGAGLSGMTAAMTLRGAGLRNVTVYESSDRVGGRLYTRKDDGFWDADQWSEWGGELIDSAHKTVFSLCRRFGFDVTDLQSHSVSTNGAEDVLWFGGSIYAWDNMVADWKAGGIDQKVSKDMQTLPPYPWAYT